MKILQVPARFYPRAGGIETVVLQTSKELVRRGHSVKIVCADEPPVGDIEVCGIKVKRLKSAALVSNTPITPLLFSQLSKEEFDILHIHFPHPWSADIGALVSFLKKKPLFVTYYNDITGTGLNRAAACVYNHSVLKLVLGYASRIFIIQDNYLASFPSLKKYTGKNIVVPMGVDRERFKPCSSGVTVKPNSIFFLSRLDRFHFYKGLDYLLEALSDASADTNVSLYVGGEGDTLDYYKNKAAELGVGSSVIFLGRLTDDQCAQYYNACDCFVLPSISRTHEGFGLVALEAMACRKPVIVSDIVGMAEDVRKNDAGIVIKPQSSLELSAAIKYIFSDTGLRRRMAQNAYNMVETKYGWDKCVDVMEAEYINVLGKYR